MKEYPSNHKDRKNIAKNKLFETIHDDQISLSAFYSKAELTIESVELLENRVNIYAHGSLGYGIWR